MARKSHFKLKILAQTFPVVLAAILTLAPWSWFMEQIVYSKSFNFTFGGVSESLMRGIISVMVYGFTILLTVSPMYIGKSTSRCSNLTRYFFVLFIALSCLLGMGFVGEYFQHQERSDFNPSHKWIYLGTIAITLRALYIPVAGGVLQSLKKCVEEVRVSGYQEQIDV